MSDPATLSKQFSQIPGVKFEAGNGGLTKIVVNGPLADAEIYLHGAHVTRYQPRGKQPVLFMSDKSWYQADKPIRGGIPVIFPWFGPRANDAAAPAHGFVRLQAWEVRQIKQVNQNIVISLGLRSSDASRKWIPNDFDLTYTVSVGATLELTLEVHNTSSSKLKFEEALHTYFVVGDVRQVSIEGLSGRTFIDKMQASQHRIQEGLIKIERETDRVYLNTTDTVAVHDPSMKRRIVIAKQGSDATVVWNPWIDKSKAMPDFGDDEWPGMLCIETVNAVDNAKTIASGAKHSMKAILGCESE